MLISQEAEGFTSQTHSHTHVTDTDLVCTGFMCWTHIWLELDVIKAHVECCLHFVSNVPLKLGLICESTNTIWPSTSYVVPGFQLWWHLHCFWHSHIHIIWSWSVWASALNQFYMRFWVHLHLQIDSRAFWSVSTDVIESVSQHHLPPDRLCALSAQQVLLSPSDLLPSTHGPRACHRFPAQSLFLTFIRRSF